MPSRRRAQLRMHHRRLERRLGKESSLLPRRAELREQAREIVELRLGDASRRLERFRVIGREGAQRAAGGHCRAVRARCRDAPSASARRRRHRRPSTDPPHRLLDRLRNAFDGASKAFLESVEQTVRLIRSKGVGVFFVTQTPKDVPGDVLAQLGNASSTRSARSRQTTQRRSRPPSRRSRSRSSTTSRVCSRSSGSARRRSRSFPRRAFRRPWCMRSCARRRPGWRRRTTSMVLRRHRRSTRSTGRASTIRAHARFSRRGSRPLHDA